MDGTTTAVEAKSTKIKYDITSALSDFDPIVEIRMNQVLFDDFRLRLEHQTAEIESLWGVPLVIDNSIESYRIIRRSVKEAIRKIRHEIRAEIQRDLHSVVSMLQGNVDRQKVINYIKEYLLEIDTK